MKRLEDILCIYKEWHDNRSNEHDFVPISLYTYLCWMFYRIKGRELS